MTFTENYKEVQKYQGSSLRSHARSLALDALSFRNKLIDVKQWYDKPRIQFLFVHHIFKDEVQTFKDLLAELSKHHTFISHSEAVERIVTGIIDRPYISWSSDDGFKNNLEAARILNEYDAKACFFLNPDSIGAQQEEWISKFCADRLKMPPVDFMDWHDVAKLQSWGHEIGSHTMNHKNLAEMSLEEVKYDIAISKEVIEKHCGKVRHFAFPYGRFFDFNKAAFEAVFNAGYESCSTGERGCHISEGRRIEKDELFIRRDQVVCGWNLQHILYFVVNNAKKAQYSDNFFIES